MWYIKIATIFSIIIFSGFIFILLENMFLWFKAFINDEKIKHIDDDFFKTILSRKIYKLIKRLIIIDSQLPSTTSVDVDDFHFILFTFTSVLIAFSFIWPLTLLSVITYLSLVHLRKFKRLEKKYNYEIRYSSNLNFKKEKNNNEKNGNAGIQRTIHWNRSE